MKKKKNTIWGRAYAVGYRFVDDNTGIQDNRKERFRMIKPTWKLGYADPFPFIYQGKHYIFVEMMDKLTEFGQIGVCCLEEGKQVVQVIREEFHMSYPNVFDWQGQIYMIPETHEAGQIRLYTAKNFPYEWKLKKILLEDVDLVDFSYKQEGKYMYAVATDISKKPYRNRFFRLDLEQWQLEELTMTVKEIVDKRPGGNFYRDGEDWYIPLQECGWCYGEYLHFVKTKEFTEKAICQEEIFELKAKDIRINRRILFDRIHTYNRYQNFETIDIYLYYFSWKKFCYVLKQNMKNKRKS